MFIFYQELLQKFKIKKKIKPVILSNLYNKKTTILKSIYFKYIKHLKIHHIELLTLPQLMMYYLSTKDLELPVRARDFYFLREYLW